jgi:hypothetical protein
MTNSFVVKFEIICSDFVVFKKGEQVKNNRLSKNVSVPAKSLTH